MPVAIINFFDTIYQGVAIGDGAVAAVCGFVACRLLLWQVRWLVTLLVLLTTVLAVWGSAHHFAMYTIGIIDYTLCSLLGLQVRARHTGTTLRQQQPYDLLVLAAGFVLAAWHYLPPPM
ncbi:MAG TPA: hypothetical protein PKM88_04530 [bacterium]|nr:hypothetical protein [bacterium]